MASQRSMLLSEYMAQVAPTDQFRADDLQPILFGLFGEVGSLMAAAKKYHREGEVYTGYRNAVEEEFGDAIWYFAALCRRVKVELDEIFAEAITNRTYTVAIAANDLVASPISHVATPVEAADLDPALVELGQSVCSLLNVRIDDPKSRAALAAFANRYVRALTAARVSFAEVLRKNISKTRGRFIPADYAALPDFDRAFPELEQLPHHFEIVVDERSGGRSHLRWNGVPIGDPLTDNIQDRDDYRFHDVFHFAHAAILHWSPTFRALIKRKRKSDPLVDEAQDGGRAAVVEEGLTAWVFTRAKELNFFAGQRRVSFDLLKTVQQFVAGYEVEACPASLWEHAILSGYEVFRQLRENRGGRVIGDRITRTIRYASLSGTDFETSRIRPEPEHLQV